ncbi:hypothetical protein B0J18DRAFT_71346 [Chaetomium sp. MPI-SDFR-AT-0129]|nr:hypothetical protein B0J18DRAFT_71346 [Chaetomium sp. MPI-SDFR-AT-0129]
MTTDVKMAGIKRKAPDDDGPDDQPSADLLPQDPPTRKPERGKPHSRLGPPAPGVSADAYFRQLYGSGPDFRSLARRDARFAAVAQSNGQLDFSDPAATMQLTKTLLKIDFGLEIDLPDDRLCPPVPNRHNYILWLKELMDSTSYEQPGRKLIGLDIGTGASCIYPILGTAQRPWHFVATDIDTKSLGYAEKNVRLNRLDEQVRVLQRKPADPLIPLDDAGVQSIDFTMMNPPFYTSEDDMLSSANKKSRPPMSACTGAPVEMVCEGGEVAHVGRLLRESLVLREKVQWYTSMVGKLSSLETLVDQLVEKGIHNYAVTEFVQGNKTRRWALGWSFAAMRPAEHAARGMKALLWKKILPHPVTAELCVLPPDRPVDDVVTHIRDVIGKLELISWVWEPETAKGVGRAKENVWSRAWRRKKAREQGEVNKSEAVSPETAELGECRLGFEIAVVVGKSETNVRLHWREGHDPLIFESLSGYLQGKLKEFVRDK